VPSRTTDLAQLAGEAMSCTRCELLAAATQTVFGDGPSDADVVLVGEQTHHRRYRG
jgi:uracil-DNA glycosylase